MGRMAEWANGKVRNSPALEVDPLAPVEVLGWGSRVMFSGPFVLFSFPEQRTLTPVDGAEWVFPWFAVVIRGFSVWVWVTLTLLGLPVQRTLTPGGPSLVCVWPETSWSTFSVSVSICACIKIRDCTRDAMMSWLLSEFTAGDCWRGSFGRWFSSSWPRRDGGCLLLAGGFLGVLSPVGWLVLRFGIAEHLEMFQTIFKIVYNYH